MTAGHIVSRAEVLIRHHGYTPPFDLGLKVAERVIDGNELRSSSGISMPRRRWPGHARIFISAGHIPDRVRHTRFLTLDFKSCLPPARKPMEALGVRLPPARLRNIPHRLGDEIVCHRKSNLIGACCEPTTIKRRGEACRECSMS